MKIYQTVKTSWLTLALILLTALGQESKAENKNPLIGLWELDTTLTSSRLHGSPPAFVENCYRNKVCEGMFLDIRPTSIRILQRKISISKTGKLLLADELEASPFGPYSFVEANEKYVKIKDFIKGEYTYWTVSGKTACYQKTVESYTFDECFRKSNLNISN